MTIEKHIQFRLFGGDSYKLHNLCYLSVSSQYPRINQNSSTLLAENEDERLNWQGVLIESEDEEHPALFVATDNRLIYSFGEGHFKDIGFNHIESVEVAADSESRTEGTNPDVIIAMGTISAVVGVIAMVVGGFTAVATLVGLGLCGLGGLGIWYGKENYDELRSEFEVVEYTVYNILLRTAAESPFTMPIYIQTEENVGPELSRLVQENQ